MSEAPRSTSPKCAWLAIGTMASLGVAITPCKASSSSLIQIQFKSHRMLGKQGQATTFVTMVCRAVKRFGRRWYTSGGRWFVGGIHYLCDNWVARVCSLPVKGLQVHIQPQSSL
eukprot:scaffold176727_cov18-Tisochrysis_lutea.AAC.1